MSLSPGHDLSHYTILDPLGAGAMGEVYRARDTRLGRDVAIKVLPQHLAEEEEQMLRFEREAKSLAKLNHPNVAQIFSVDQVDETCFLVLEFVDGVTLEERLERGSLEISDSLDVCRQICEGVAAAHEAGIVHRDLKPANVCITPDGVAKVLDFGIAKSASAPDQDGGLLLTEPGRAVGTPTYMAPEQARGAATDARADVWAIGCLLFECLTARRAFDGDSLADVLVAIFEREPDWATLPAGTPPHVRELIQSCLRKDPARRPENVAALLRQLDGTPRVSTEARDGIAPDTTPQGNLIVVMPFVNRSDDPEDEYFSDGLTDEVITDLAGVSALRVISRNSAMALKGATKDTRTLARELGVTHLVTGSVRRVGQALRVAADLVEASTDTPLWSQRFKGTMEDVFGIQEEISRQIVSALEVRLTANEEREVHERRIDDPVAFDCYLRARQVMYHWTPAAQQQALQLVDQAIDVIGETPVLLATQGQIHWNMVQTGLGPEKEGLESASSLAARALELDPGHDLSIYVRGLVAGTRGQAETALPDLHRAHQLRPGDGNVLVELTRFSQSAGVERRSTVLAELLRVDPLAPQAQLLAAMGAYYDGRPEEAGAPARRARELSPDPSMLHCIVGLMLAHAGCREEATEVFDCVVASRAADPHRHVAAFLRHAINGEADRAAGVPIASLEPVLCNEHLLRMIADGHALLGRQEDALRVLRRALRHGFINHPNLAIHSATLEPLRESTEFQALLAEVEPRWRAIIEWERGRIGV